jgi:O-antigen ligase
LPPAIWEQLGGRAPIAAGYRTLGIPAPWLPVSLTPYESLGTLLAVIPPLAVLAGVIRLGGRPVWLALALVIGAVAGVILGALQVSSGVPESSPWYLYARTNYGVATGFFANANHMASLLVITLPFLAAMLASARGATTDVQRYSAAFALVAGTALLICVGIALNGSLAGYGLAVPVLAASVLLLLPRASRVSRLLAIGSALLLVGAVAFLLLRPVSGSGLPGSGTSVQSRQEIFATTARAAREFMPAGSGLGSFRSVYAMAEDRDRLDASVVINHAHNDFLELALELGLAGIVLIAAFLLWWSRAAWTAWISAGSSPYARAAAIASAAILAHSLVDFPLRTAAISACFAMCLALLTVRAPVAGVDRSKLWPTRHVVLA